MLLLRLLNGSYIGSDRISLVTVPFYIEQAHALDSLYSPIDPLLRVCLWDISCQAHSLGYLKSIPLYYLPLYNCDLSVKVTHRPA